MKKNSSNVYIIAEIGVNHGGCIETAFQMIDAAKLSGADAVKFQTFKAENLVSRETPKVRYQLSTTNDKESHYEMIENLEFKYEDHLPVMKYCIKQDIDFISTPYDIESAKFLNEIGVEVFKTASADIVDIPLHKFIASTKKEVIISVGMATYKEIEEVLEVYKEDLSRVTLLHCVSNYPCAFESLNLNILQTLKEKYKVNIGYSDHAIGEYPSVLAVALGAKVIEKHFTIDKNLPGPDHKASSSPGEFKILVDSVRIAEKCLGSFEKNVQDEEMQMRLVSRKSLFYAKDIKKGETLREEHFISLRPGTGIYPGKISELIGTKLSRNVTAKEIVNHEHLVK